MLTSVTTETSTASAHIYKAEYGCTTCTVHFSNSKEQRAHMRGDWHVNNLKRRIASQPSISVTEFHQKLLTSASRSDESGIHSQFRKWCATCEEHYTSRKGWRAHLKAQHHEWNRSQLSPGTSSHLTTFSLLKSCEETNEEDFSPLQCLFCTCISPSMDLNLRHMSHAHSFFIPKIKYLVDTKAFIGYLFTIIFVFHECLLCGSSKTTRFGVQDHMRRKGHCTINFKDSLHQFEQFYDFEDVSYDRQELEKEDVLVPEEHKLHLTSGKTLIYQSRSNHAHRRVRDNIVTSLSEETLRYPSPTEKGVETRMIPAGSREKRIMSRTGIGSSLAGVPELKLRALLAVEKKMIEMEVRGRNEYQSKLERGGNKQKRFKVKSIGKKQGGLEKRLG